ncbi:amidohydrolase [Acinetobacter larvae]|uniref:Hydrolase n=1 Tax=Acinetobacter larvae TaxID=1789224 RepID=A0A1B2LVU9_9GAMM|nr:amidohydrolase [Acinetobacter larvae]AOA57044.1 hydrolase [Acinetobacter larvae]
MTSHRTNIDLQQQLLVWRRELHQFPELSGQEHQTTARLQDWLAQFGISSQQYGLTTGLVVDIGQGQPVVALRADLDALPIQEQSSHDHTSTVAGVMHACGHDLHTAVILGAAILLKQQEHNLSGRVRIIFQPAEENYSGAYAVLAQGILTDVDVIFGMHNEPNLALGHFATRQGAFYANVDKFNVLVKGKGAHAGRPHEGQDAIYIASQLVVALQAISSRRIDTLETCVVSVTQIHAGNTWNVLPATVSLEGTARTHSKATRQLVEQHFKQIAAGIASAYGVEIEIDWQHGPAAVINHPHWADFATTLAEQQGYQVQQADLHLGGEDFAAYLEQIPGAFVSIGSASSYGLHHPEFHGNEALIYPAAQYFAALAQAALWELHSNSGAPEQHLSKHHLSPNII